nr:MAG TPA: hypothetical protein [Bacteriophage sp.]
MTFRSAYGILLSERGRQKTSKERKEKSWKKRK